MMRRPTREALFYYFRMEDQVLKPTCCGSSTKHISFEFVRRQLKAATAKPDGRRSIPNFCCACC